MLCASSSGCFDSLMVCKGSVQRLFDPRASKEVLGRADKLMKLSE